MMLDLKKLFPDTKFHTAEELKAKEDTFSIGDRVKVSENIRCRQHGQIGTIVQIDPEDKHGWKSFIVKFNDEKYNPMGFNSGDIDKINEKETTMKKINENMKITLTIGQLKHLVKESANDSDFKIEDGILVKYNGAGGDVVIPNGVTSIGKRAFFNRGDITSVTIPDSVTTIGQDAFRWCKGLTSVTIPNSVTSIKLFAFENCSNLTSVTIPDSVTRIEWATFSSNIRLKSVIIGNSVTEIGSSAFSGCHDLDTVTIPNSVTNIGRSAFLDCNSLKSITIPDSVTTIGEAAFAGCWGLTSVTIPNSVTEIGQGVFASCSGLKSVEISNSLKWIPHYTFQECNGLMSVAIPNSVEKIGVYAFEDCKNLKSVVLPDSVTDIGEGAFNNCENLDNVKINNPDLLDDVMQYPEETFKGTPWRLEIDSPRAVKESKMKRKINENQKVTLTFGQLKRLVSESQEWVGKWSAIDGHPDGGEMDAEFEGYCDCCGEYVDDPSRLHTLYGWFINDESCRTDNDEWNRVDSMAAKMDDNAYEEFVSDFDCDLDDYCEYCAIDKLGELAKKYLN